MSLGHGASVVRNGLVFQYDMSNTAKSWKGKPTTNEFVTGMLNGAYGGDGTLQPGVADAFGKNSPVYRKTGKIRFGNTAGTDEGTLYYGGDYVFSIYMRLTTNHTNTSGFEFDIVDRQSTIWVDGEVISDNIRNHMTYEWRRFSVYANHNNNANYRFIDIGIYQSTTNEFEWCCPMIEQGTWPSPYIPWSSTHQSRSNTEAIIDLAGNNTITASNLTYNSDNTFSFNGISDYMDLPISHSYLESSTLEIIVKIDTLNTALKQVLFGYRHNTGFSNPTIGSIYTNSGYFSASVITTSEVYRIVGDNSLGVISQGQYYHVVLTKDTINGTLKLYRNGVLGGTQTFDTATYAQWSSVGNYIGADRLDIGRSYNSAENQGWVNYLDGEIPLAKVYDRVLTAEEIKQNFEATRGRYGI